MWAVNVEPILQQNVDDFENTPEPCRKGQKKREASVEYVKPAGPKAEGGIEETDIRPPGQDIELVHVRLDPVDEGIAGERKEQKGEDDE